MPESVSFLEAHLDYLYFLYGLTFFVMAQTSFTLGKDGKYRLPWVWFALFGYIQGVVSWLELVVLVTGDNYYLSVFRVLSDSLSFLLVAEFGRAGWVHIKGKGPGRWIFLPLLAFTAAGFVGGLHGFEVASCIALGFVGGLWSAQVFYLEGRRPDGKVHPWLAYAAVGTGIYAVAAGLAVPLVPRSPTSPSAFFNVAWLPMQFLKGASVALIAISLLAYRQVLERRAPAVNILGPKSESILLPISLILMVLVSGWLFTDQFAMDKEVHFKQGALSRTMIAASAINPERVKTLTGTPADIGKPDYERLHSQLQSIRWADKDCRSACIETINGNRFITLVNSHDGSLAPCDFHNAPQPAYFRDYRAAKGVVYGPCKSGPQSWVTSTAPVLDQNGKTLAILCMDIDANHYIETVVFGRFYCIITIFVLCISIILFFIARKRRKELAMQSMALQVAALRLEEEKKLRYITSALGEGVYVLDKDGLLTFMNPEAERLLGWSEAELKRVYLHDLIHRHGSRKSCPVLMTFVSGETRNVESDIFMRKDGTIFPVAYVCAPIIEDGEIRGVVTSFRDITEHKLAEEELQKFKFIVDEIGEEFYMLDLSGKVKYANKASAGSLGYAMEELLDMSIADFDLVFGGEKFKDRLQELEGRDVPPFETLHRTRDGRLIQKEVKAILLEIADVIYLCAFVRDITERKRLEQQRNDFYAMVTHDLKAPLSTVIAYTDILTEDRLQIDDKSYGMLVNIRSNCRKLIQTVDDFLAISRLEYGKISLNKAPEDITELFWELAEEFGNLARKKNISLEKVVEEGIPKVTMDRSYVKRAVSNLLQNAINYTAHGRISLKARVRKEQNRNYLEISVSDTGMGIPSKYYEKIFEKFYRCPINPDMVKGSGLGLAIVKTVTDAHDGRVELNSEEGKGSEFRMLLPA